jgi:hypothetical protein
MVDASQATGTITVNHKVSGYSRYWKGTYDANTRYTKTWKNWCPLCKAAGKLVDNKKGTSEGEITCNACDADYDGVTGQDKHGGGSRGCLIAADGTGDTSTESESEEVETTITHGYDIEKPFQCYIRIEYSLSSDITAPRHKIQFSFTEDAPDVYASFDGDNGITPAFINMASRFNRINVIDKIRIIEGDFEKKNRYWLRQISFCHSQGTTDEDKPYEGDGTDDSSCKMILDTLAFTSLPVVNPETVGACGKTVLENIKTLTEKANYSTSLSYGEYRFQDHMNFKKNGYDYGKEKWVHCRQDSNILAIENVSYTPITNLVNDSIKVFKSQTNPTDDNTIKYKYVQSRNPELVLRYGDCQDVESLSEVTSPSEAYYLAYTNEKLVHIDTLVNNIGFTYTLTVEGVPDCEVGGKAYCVFDNPVMNDVKTVQSIQVDYDITKRPRLRTTIGAGEMDNVLKGRQDLQSQRNEIKSRRSSYSGGATYESDVNYNADKN